MPGYGNYFENVRFGVTSINKHADTCFSACPPRQNRRSSTSFAGRSLLFQGILHTGKIALAGRCPAMGSMAKTYALARYPRINRMINVSKRELRHAHPAETRVLVPSLPVEVCSSKELFTEEASFWWAGARHWKTLRQHVCLCNFHT